MTPTIIIDSVARVPAEAVTPLDACRIEDDLTFRTYFKKDYGFGKKAPVRLYEESEDGGLLLPRGYDLSAWTNSGRVEIRQAPSLGQPVAFSFREDVQSQETSKKKFQDGLIETFLARLASQPGSMKGGILSAPCGSGKTCMSLKIASRLGLSTLVLVNKGFLQKQWVRELLKFTDMEKGDIGLVQQKKCQFEGKKVVVAMIQSLLSREYPPELFTWPGVILADEVHRLAAEKWCRVSALFPAAYRIGVSATPRRKDGLTKVLSLTIGDVLAKGWSYGLVPNVYQVQRHTYVPEARYHRKAAGGREETTFLATFLNLLVKVEPRNEWLVSEMLAACAKGRKIFILSARREHLDILRSMFHSGCSGRYTSGFYVGQMKQADLDASAQCDAIFGTYSMAAEGLDIPAMDTLYLATPMADVEQATGRILRNHDGKKTPVVVDPVDDIPLCLDWGKKRLKQYERLGYNVKVAPDYASVSLEGDF